MTWLLVTGGSGFIGSNYIRYVLEHDKEVSIINFDLLTYAGHKANTIEVEEDERYIFVQGDIANVDQVRQIFETYPVDRVVNFAAETHVDNSIESPSAFIRTNVLGTQVLLEVAKTFWMRGKDDAGYPIYKTGVKFLQISTDEVYGSLGKNGYFTEDSPLKPNSPYSASKTSGDLLVRAYHMTYHLPINITRCSNNYGPKQHPEKFIPAMILKAMNDVCLPIYGDGLQIRDWIHVADHCRAVHLVLEKGIDGEVYNVGGNQERQNIEIAKLILTLMKKNGNLIQHISDRLGHDRRYAINHQKLTNSLGWQPSYEFNKGLEETVNWYVTSKTWVKMITTEKS